MGRLRITFALVALALIAGCAPSRPVAPGAPPPLPFALTLMPRAVIAGGALWVRCYVPDTITGRGSIRYGIEGIRVSTSELDGRMYSLLVERVGCPGPWTAVCSVHTTQHREQRTAAVEVLGCDDGEI